MKYILVLSLALASLVSALTPDEFKTLYERRDKDAEACYALHKAYLEGDGVEKNAAQSHKWLLGAYELGMSGARGELGAHPLRKKMKLNTKVKHAKVPDKVAQEKGLELLNVLQDSMKHVSAMVGVQEPAPADVVNEVRRLLNAGADPNVYARRPGMQRWTPLACAASFFDLKLIKLLIDAGADPAAYGFHAFMGMAQKDGSSYMRRNEKAYMEQGRQMDAAMELMARHCNLSGYTCDGWSPLYYAVNNNAVNMARIFLKNGAEVNAPQKALEISGPVDTKAYYYQTGLVGSEDYPLNCAVRHDNLPMVRLLLEHGANPALSNNEGEDALKALDATLQWKKKAGAELSGNETEIRSLLRHAPAAAPSAPDKPAGKAKKKKKRKA